MPNNDPYNPTGARNPNDPANMSERVSEMANDARNKVTETASQLADKASEVGRQTINKIDEKRMGAADALHHTASTLRGTAQSSSQRITSFADSTATTLENTANYVREHDVKGMMGDLEQVFRRNPGPSMIAAAALGFLLGSAMWRNSSRD